RLVASEVGVERDVGPSEPDRLEPEPPRLGDDALARVRDWLRVEAGHGSLFVRDATQHVAITRVRQLRARASRWLSLPSSAFDYDTAVKTTSSLEPPPARSARGRPLP